MPRLLLGLGILGLVAALLVSVSSVHTEDVSAASLTKQSISDLQPLQQAVEAGQILHVVSESRNRPAPADWTGLAWVHPERTYNDFWLAVDSEGAYTTQSTRVRDADGEVIAYTELRDGQVISTWVATGDEHVIATSSDLDAPLSSWFSYFWAVPANYAQNDDYERVGSDRVGGQEIAIFERTETVTSPGQTSQNFVFRREFNIDQPLLMTEAKYSVDANGVRVLEHSHSRTSYELLPANTPIDPSRA